MLRPALALALTLVLAGPAVADDAVFRRPDARVTLQVPEVEVAALLVFLARVGGAEVKVEPAIKGTARDVTFANVRVEDAFAQVLRQNRLVLSRVSGVLVVTRGEEIKTPEPPIAPAPARPELVLPPTP